MNKLIINTGFFVGKMKAGFLVLLFCGIWFVRSTKECGDHKTIGACMDSCKCRWCYDKDRTECINVKDLDICEIHTEINAACEKDSPGLDIGLAIASGSVLGLMGITMLCTMGLICFNVKPCWTQFWDTLLDRLSRYRRRGAGEPLVYYL